MPKELPLILFGLIIGIEVLRIIFKLFEKRELLGLNISNTEFTNRLKEHCGENSSSFSKYFLTLKQASEHDIHLQLNHQIPKSILNQELEQMSERVIELSGPVSKNNCHHVVDFLLLSSGMEVPSNFNKWDFYTLLYDHSHTLRIIETDNKTQVKIYQSHNKNEAVSGLFMKLHIPGSFWRSVKNIDLKYTSFSNRIECKGHIFSDLAFLFASTSLIMNIFNGAESAAWFIAIHLAFAFCFCKYIATVLRIHQYQQLLDQLVAKLIERQILA